MIRKPEMFSVILPFALFYLLTLLRPLSAMFVRLFLDKDRAVDEERPFSSLFFVPGSELALVSIVLDLVELLGKWYLRFDAPRFSSGDGLVYLALPVLLFFVHLQLYIFTQIIERRLRQHDSEFSSRTRLRMISLVLGMISLFTNSLSISALLGPKDF